MKKYSAKAVADKLNCKVSTINLWYAFKKENSTEDSKYYSYAKMLPEYTRGSKGPRGTRYWTEEDIEKLREFQQSIPHGRNGILGDVTKRYSINE